MLKDSPREFPHQCLTIRSTLTRNDKISPFDYFIESYHFEQQLNTRLAFSIKILQESIAEATCRTCTFHVRTVETKVTG